MLARRIESAADVKAALAMIIEHLCADSGSVHMMEADGMLHLRAAQGIPEPVLNMVRIIPIGKGMAGLAAQRREPVTVCNLQTDSSGDVRPGAKATGLEGAIVVPIFDERGGVVGTLGIANRSERTFTEDEQRLLIECGRFLAAHSKPQ